MGVMGGSIDIVLRGFAGINILDDKVSIEPRLPKAWRSLKCRFVYKGVWFSLAITRRNITVTLKGQVAIPVEINGRLYYPHLGRALRVSATRK